MTAAAAGTGADTPVPRIEIHPATAERFADATIALGEGDARGCACQYYRLASADFGRAKRAEPLEMLRRQTESSPPPGLVAYVDGEPAGWVGFGPRTVMERLARSRTIPKVDDRAVWSILCFTVRSAFRRRRLADRLLRAAVEFSRESGVEWLEAYPADTGGRRIAPSAGYVGTLSMFERAGFAVVAPTAARSGGAPRVLVRLWLGGDGETATAGARADEAAKIDGHSAK